MADSDVRAALSEDDIRAKFDLGYHTKHVDTIFARVLEHNVAWGLENARIVLGFPSLAKGVFGMKLKATLAALALILSPAIASAMCSSMKIEQTASACAEGQVWDSASSTCIEPVSS